MILGIVIGVVSVLLIGGVVWAGTKKHQAKMSLREGRSWAPEAPGGDARVIDPEDPPRTVLCPPRQAAKGLRCTCHNRPVQANERIMLWPIAGSKTADHPQGAMDVYCSETLLEAGA